MSIIEIPVMDEARSVTAEWRALPSWLPVPGMGVLPVNSFLLKGAHPVLVDTGLGALGDAFLRTLEDEIDLEDLRWIWLSHLDADHSGNLARILGHAPNARVVTNFLGQGKMTLAGLDVSRVHLLEPGAVFDTGERRLVPVRPPYYDAPETVGFFDVTDGVFFAADSFGALLPEPVREFGDIGDDTLRDGLLLWSSIDAPWLASIDRPALNRMLSALDRIDPACVLSGHLPVVRNGISALTGPVAEAYGRGSLSAVDPLAVENVAAGLS